MNLRKEQFNSKKKISTNKIMYYLIDDSLNYPYDNEQYDCAEHSDLLKKCK